MSSLRWIIFSCIIGNCLGDIASERLFEDLLKDYQRLARPVHNTSQILHVSIRIQLIQLYDINEKKQIMTTGLIIHHEWMDSNLVVNINILLISQPSSLFEWDPADYDGVQTMTLPSTLIWKPDLVLYNSADGSPSVAEANERLTKAIVHSNGLVRWSPPAIFSSLCEIDVTWFPYDVQICLLKFGTWTYDGSMIDLAHYDHPSQVLAKATPNPGLTIWTVAWDAALDLKDFYPSVEWDLVNVTAEKRLAIYPCCPAPFIDLNVQLHLRRKALFYTVNLVCPCVGLSVMTSLVFHLPADSYGKMMVSISILVSTNVFFLLLVEIIPASSLVVPLIARYLLFTLVLVFISVVLATGMVNLHCRTPTMNRMPMWVRRYLLKRLPRLLGMKSIQSDYSGLRDVVVGMMERSLRKDSIAAKHAMERGMGGREVVNSSECGLKRKESIEAWERRVSLHPMMIEASMAKRRCSASSGPHMKLHALRYTASSVGLIVHAIKKEAQENELAADWRYLTRVLDRIFLFLFTAATICGAASILQAPTLYDYRPPLTASPRLQL